MKTHHQFGKRLRLGRDDNTEHQVSQTTGKTYVQIEVNSSTAGIESGFIDSADVWTMQTTVSDDRIIF